MDPEKQKANKQETSKDVAMQGEDERELSSGNLASELNSMSGGSKEYIIL